MDGIIADSRPLVAIEYNPNRWEPSTVVEPFRERGYEVHWLLEDGETEPVQQLLDAAEYEGSQYEEIILRPP
jgi:hypothetical protein